MWGGEPAAPSGQGPCPRKQTQHNSAGHPRAWKEPEAVASSIKWWESSSGLKGSKIRFQSLGLRLTCCATPGKLIYFSELDSLFVNLRFTSQNVCIHSVIQEILTQLLLSRKGRSMCWQQ